MTGRAPTREQALAAWERLTKAAGPGTAVSADIVRRFIEASGPEAEADPEKNRDLILLWRTLEFFARESSYTTGERTGGVLQGCPRNPPPGPADLAGYGRQGLAALCRFLGRDPHPWMTNQAAAPFPDAASCPKCGAGNPVMECDCGHRWELGD